MPELTAPTRQQKITLGEMRSSGVRGLLVYCADYSCGHAVRISGDRWPDHIRLSELEPLFVCQRAAEGEPISERNSIGTRSTRPGAPPSADPFTLAPRSPIIKFVGAPPASQLRQPRAS